MKADNNVLKVQQNVVSDMKPPMSAACLRDDDRKLCTISGMSVERGKLKYSVKTLPYNICSIKNPACTDLSLIPGLSFEDFQEKIQT
jgi:hypothetical protein